MAWRVGVVEFRRNKGDASYLDAVRNAKDPSIAILIFENSADMIGIAVAFLGILLSQLTGILVFDGIASMVIGVILIAAALWLAHETKSLLIGEGADQEIIQGIRSLVNSQVQNSIHRGDYDLAHGTAVCIGQHASEVQRNRSCQ